MKNVFIVTTIVFQKAHPNIASRKMRSSLFVLVTCLLVATLSHEMHYDQRNVKKTPEEHFHHFQQRFQRQYESDAEHKHRLQVFKNNLEIIDQLRDEETGSTRYDVTKFADLTQEEFQSSYLKALPLHSSHQNKKLQEPQKLKTHELSKNAPPIPQNFDWRDHNAVTAPENLGACDSSWISAAVQAVESAWYLGGHDLVQLSTQQVVDCFNDPTTGSSGCKGGDIQKAYQYIAEHGLQMKADYPYRASQSKCVFNETAVISYIDGFLLATSNRSELQMQYSLLEYGPLAICLDAGYRWQFYAGGVISHLCGETVNHCVLLTGYKDYYEAPWGTYEVWNIKNNWGKDWGESGYVYVERGNDVCGVAKMATVPVISTTIDEHEKRRKNIVIE